MYWNQCPGKPEWCRAWLIETWDVLKCHHFIVCLAGGSGLIETWDVLKELSDALGVTLDQWLIETWDVLKCLFKLTHKAVCD